MAKKIFVDMHHSSLLRSLIMLFEQRLGYEVYRPIGLQWFIEGYWGISNQYDTAKQFLSLGQVPQDGTPPLNSPRNTDRGIYYCYDPGNLETNRACTLEYFKKHEFDYLIATIPAHIPIFERLIAQYQHKAKLIVQLGNEWPSELFIGRNILASIAPRFMAGQVQFYHQEFSTAIFHPTVNTRQRDVYSFVNVLQNMPEAQADFDTLELLLKPYGYKVKSFGGQNRDGNMTGPYELAKKMRQADFILHTKPGGDGFGHVIFNAYAVGRPLIARSSQYVGKLAEQLLVPGTFIDLDELGIPYAAQVIRDSTPETLAEMGQLAYRRFTEVVDYNKEAEEIRVWLQSL